MIEAPRLLDFTGLVAALAQLPELRLRQQVPLRSLSRWQIGGPARVVVEPLSVAATAQALRLIKAHGVPLLVIGDGSNLLFDDEGFDGVVLHIGRAMSSMRIEGRRVVAQAGIWTPIFARRVGCAGLSGAEHAVGIPGTLGGLVVMNGGSLRKGIGENLVSVTCLDHDGETRVLSHDECGFAYRTSVLQTRELIVVEAEFEFIPGEAREIRREMIKIMAARRKKFPLRLPNCGSVFLSNPAMYDTVGPPGKAIEEAGLRGTRIGDAQIAPEHGNFIVNLGAARSADVLALIGLVRKAVYERTRFWLDCEVRHVSGAGVLKPAHEALPDPGLFTA
ncbi:MAG TPA: UDP-N-acetylmuramate dehydrogenase [Ideonella sp.]|uniref:UDP-N-acetylmuramate dehydrogenase n=1 Tax=Ideonella sp. TaxID=1929293 RepID=UPI002B99D484|nr:UDP-N-acetylmuramate dehydrogenase [Ideonella sp.]HSI50559.1 UDP-N-acetylmuramate dehydrogenase [Ideonella sp.]